MRGIKNDPARSANYVSWWHQEHLFFESLFFAIAVGLLMCKIFGII